MGASVPTSTFFLFSSSRSSARSRASLYLIYLGAESLQQGHLVGQGDTVGSLGVDAVGDEVRTSLNVESGEVDVANVVLCRVGSTVTEQMCEGNAGVPQICSLLSRCHRAAASVVRNGADLLVHLAARKISTGPERRVEGRLGDVDLRGADLRVFHLIHESEIVLQGDLAALIEREPRLVAALTHRRPR
jgi:hypothetical protein